MTTPARPQLGSLLTAMVTPFTAGGELDLEEAGRIARWLVEQGNDGLVIAGSTGEGTALDDDEKIALFRAAKTAVGTSATIVAGATGPNTKASVALTKRAEETGVDGILATVPAYCKPTQDGMLVHFGAIAEATKLPLIIYNIPSRTGANLQPATLLELARRHANIAGVKESSGDFAQFSAILRDRKPGFAFWSGDDHLFLPTLALGGDGLISVAAHVCGRELRELLEAHARGDVGRAAALHLAVTPLLRALFETSSPIPVKWAMGQFGFRAGACRSPLGAMPPALAQSLGALLEPYRGRASEIGAAAR
jgi:4-hydroxy-tetrahydrodipicolinate synthase